MKIQQETDARKSWQSNGIILLLYFILFFYIIFINVFIFIKFSEKNVHKN